MFCENVKNKLLKKKKLKLLLDLGIFIKKKKKIFM